MKFQNRQTGIIGEGIAANYLQNLGYELLSRNFSTRFGEIDLVMKDKNILVFVEVKTKKGLGFGLPEEMFTRSKYHKVRNMATVYLKGKSVPCRIDMVAIVLDATDQPESIKHYTNVVL